MVQEYISGFMSSAFMSKIFFTLMMVAVLAVISLGLYFFVHFKKYRDKVVILKRIDDEGRVTRRFDFGGVFRTKSGGVEYRLLRSKAVLDVSNYKYIPNDVKGRTVFVYQHEENNYTFAFPKLVNQDIEITVGQEDVTGAIRDFEKFSNAFNKQSVFMQILPMVGLIVFAFTVIVVLAMLFQKFDVLSSLADSLKETASTLAHMRQAAVTSSAPI